MKSAVKKFPESGDDFEAAEVRGRRDIVRGLLADEAAEGAVADGLEEGLDLVGVAGGEVLHPAIGEIADPAGDFKAGGDLADGVPEADALDSAFVEYLAGGHGDGRCGQRRGGAVGRDGGFKCKFKCAGSQPGRLHFDLAEVGGGGLGEDGVHVAAGGGLEAASVVEGGNDLDVPAEV